MQLIACEWLLCRITLIIAICRWWATVSGEMLFHFFLPFFRKMPYNHLECSAFSGANELVVVILKLFWHRNTLIFKFIQQQQQQNNEKPFPNPKARNVRTFSDSRFRFSMNEDISERIDNSSDAANVS